MDAAGDWSQVRILGKTVRKGYVIAVVEYRHSGIAPFPATALDIRNAIRLEVNSGQKKYIKL